MSEQKVKDLEKEVANLRALLQSGGAAEELRLEEDLAFSDKEKASLWGALRTFIKHGSLHRDTVMAYIDTTYNAQMTIRNAHKAHHKSKTPWKLIMVTLVITVFGALIILNPPEAFALGQWLNSYDGKVALLIFVGILAFGYLIYRQRSKKREQQS